MKTCKKKPNVSTCRNCLDTQIMYGVVEDCSKCSVNTKRYEIVDIQCNMFGTYVILLADGELSKASISDVYDIKKE